MIKIIDNLNKNPNQNGIISKKILIVDDDSFNVFALNEIIKSRG